MPRLTTAAIDAADLQGTGGSLANGLIETLSGSRWSDNDCELDWKGQGPAKVEDFLTVSKFNDWQF